MTLLKSNIMIETTLNDKQRQILLYLEQGLTQKEIAGKLQMDLSKLRLCIYALCDAWQCRNAVQLVSIAIRKNVI